MIPISDCELQKNLELGINNAYTLTGKLFEILNPNIHHPYSIAGIFSNERFFG